MACVLAEGHVPRVVQGPDLPVPAHDRDELSRGGLLGAQTGDRVDALDGCLSGAGVLAAAHDLQGLDGVRKARPVPVAALRRRILSRP